MGDKIGLFDCHDREIAVGDEVKIINLDFQGKVILNSFDCQFEVRHSNGQTISLLPESPESKYIEII